MLAVGWNGGGAGAGGVEEQDAESTNTNDTAHRNKCFGVNRRLICGRIRKNLITKGSRLLPAPDGR